MKAGFTKFSLFILSLFVLVACEYPGSIGLDIVEEDQFDMVYLDTITAKLSTIKFDSLVSSTSGRLLVGKHLDDTYGNLTTYAGFQLGLDSISTYPDQERSTYTKTTLEMMYDGYSYYDTTQEQTYHLYRLLDDLEYEDDGYLYNTNRFPYDSLNEIGSVTVAVRPNQHTYAEMSLDDSLGTELFELVRSEDDLVSNEEDFLEVYKGFVLVPDAANSNFVGFSTATQIRVYYEEGGEEYSIVFPINDNIYYTAVDDDRSQTLYAPLYRQRDDLSSHETNEQALLEGASGLAIKFEVPYIKSLLSIGNGVYITEAFLRLKPVKNTYSTKATLPTELEIYRVDALNRVVSTYDSTFTLVQDQEFQEDTYYSLPISGYLNSLLTETGEEQDALMIMLPEDTNPTSADKLVAGDRFSDNPTTVEIYLMKNYKSQ